MNSKFVSFASIVERVYRSTEYEVIPWQDIAEDILDILRLVGVRQSYIDKTTNGQGNNPSPIIVQNFIGELPMDLAKPGPCRAIGLDSDSNIIGFVPMTEDPYLFYQSPTLQEENTSYSSSYASNIVEESLELKMDQAQEEIDDNDLTGAAETLEGILNDIEATKLRTQGTSSSTLGFNPKYKLNNGFIYTNFKNGFVEMSYRALPIDDYGMPMVPDNERYIKAVEWYLIYRLDHKRWRTTRNSMDKEIMRDSEQQYLWYVGGAKTKALTPSMDMMEAIKNMILRSIPKINAHKSGFANTDIIEKRKF